MPTEMAQMIEEQTLSVIIKRNEVVHLSEPVISEFY